MLHILELEIRGVKKIRAVRINPETNKPTVITGDNAQGKSSVLDAVLLALQNKGLEDPINHKSQTAEVIITLGDGTPEYTVRRKVTKKGTYLEIKDATGAAVPSPQKFLNSMVGSIAFDPHEFARETDLKKQAEILRQVTGLQTADLDEQIKEVYEDRRLAKRRLADQEASRTAIDLPDKIKPEDVPKEIPDPQEIQDTYQRLARQRADFLRMKEDYIQQVKALKEKKAVLEAMEVPKEEEVKEAKEKASSAYEISRAATAFKLHRNLSEEIATLKNTVSKQTGTINELKKNKAERIEKAKMPIDGLEITDEAVLFNDVRFDQLSTAEQVKVSTAIAIAQNPELRNCLIREGALMNKATWSWLAKLCEKENFGILIEKFQEEPGDTGLHIVDGEVAFMDGQPVESEEVVIEATDPAPQGEEGEEGPAGEPEPQPEPEPETDESADDFFGGDDDLFS